MNITVFAKKRTSEEGRKFLSYFGRLKKKDGSDLSVGIRFRDTCPGPKQEDCPMNVIVEKSDANLSERHYEDEDSGEIRTAYTLWVAQWVPDPNEFEDHSLDDFD